jgi:ubiquinol-cytochrome c reductase iron-sulfur subunit
VFVGVGICTHLACSPTAVSAGSNNPSAGSDWTGGLICPCHGSTVDLAGRVFKNKPAPTNLEVPRHKYLSDGRLLIGEDDAGAA